MYVSVFNIQLYYTPHRWWYGCLQNKKSVLHSFLILGTRSDIWKAATKELWGLDIRAQAFLEMPTAVPNLPHRQCGQGLLWAKEPLLCTWQSLVPKASAVKTHVDQAIRLDLVQLVLSIFFCNDCDVCISTYCSNTKKLLINLGGLGSTVCVSTSTPVRVSFNSVSTVWCIICWSHNTHLRCTMSIHNTSKHIPFSTDLCVVSKSDSTYSWVKK